jgi:hypothetical protein
MSENNHWPLYPDIQAAGGLGPALEAEFTRMGVVLDVHGFAAGNFARVKEGGRSCEMALASRPRLILPGFWSDGILMGNGKTPHLSDCAEGIAAWIKEGVSVAIMKERFPFFQVSEGAEEFEGGRGVDYVWSKMDWLAQEYPRLMPLVETARRSPQLRQLLPFTSHESLHFSRCTGFPYTEDVAHAVPLGEGRYRALGPGYRIVERTHHPLGMGDPYHYKVADYDLLGEGDAEHVIDLIVSALPEGCGPAIRGTAADLERDNEA